MKLLLSQKNQLFDIIESSNFSPIQFIYEDISPTTIKHKKSTSFYFKFFSPPSSSNGRSYFSYCHFSPGTARILESQAMDNWQEVAHVFTKWLNNLRREVQQEDKWKLLEEELKSINVSFTEDKSQFSASEYEVLQNKFSLLKQHFSNIGLEEKQYLALSTKLDFLLNEAKHMNKFDWKSLFVGTIINVIVALAISHDQGIEIWKIIKQIFSNYLLY